MANFQGKVVWVTGASSGIGEALAKAFVAEGAKVIISARREDELKRVQQQCENPAQVKILSLDLMNNSQAAQWAEAAVKCFGRLDLLVNNGGIGQFGSALETREMVERKIFEINYFGSVALAKAVLPIMQKQGNGHIVSIGSIAGKFGQANLAAYSASKAALILYFESLREECHQSPVKIQVVSPGFIKTQVTVNSLKPDGSKMEKNSPAQENGMPAEVFAQKFLKAIQKNKFHHYIGNKELLAVPLHGLAPGLFYKLLRK